jgi:NAD(P)H dehydrogenase (quinone)
MTNCGYAVTGASGHLGGLAVQELLARGVPSSDIVAIVRSRSKVADLAERGVDVRVADYIRPDTWRAALVGVNRLLLVSSSEAGQRLAHHTNVIAATKTAGVSRIVYTGMLNADHTSNPLAGEHQDTERALHDAGLPFNVLRNGWYTENYGIRPNHEVGRRPAHHHLSLLGRRSAGEADRLSVG